MKQNHPECVFQMDKVTCQFNQNYILKLIKTQLYLQTLKIKMKLKNKFVYFLLDVHLDIFGKVDTSWGKLTAYVFFHIYIQQKGTAHKK